MLLDCIVKKLSLCLALLALSFVGAQAQALQDPVMTLTPAESWCEQNGSIKLKIANEGGYHSFTLSAENKKTGAHTSTVNAVIPNREVLLPTLTAGTYKVTVRAEQNGGGATKTFTFDNIVVPGNYVPLLPAPNDKMSRPSLSACATGSLFVDIKGSRASNPANLVFKLVSAPAGFPTSRLNVPLIVAKVANGANNTYKLPYEDCPVGTYVLSVDDGCSSVSTTLTVKEFNVTQFPKLAPAIDWRVQAYRYKSDFPYKPTCSAPNVFLVAHPTSLNDAATAEYLREGKFEVALASETEFPTDDKFQTWDYGKYDYILALDISPKKISDFYGKKMRIIIRSKDCPSLWIAEEALIFDPRLEFRYDGFVPDYTVACGKVKQPFTVGRASWGLYCFPITVVATPTDGGPVLTEVLNDVNQKSEMMVDINKEYSYVVTDANGVTYPAQKWTHEHMFKIGQREFTDCNHFDMRFNPASFVSCIPYEVEFFNKTTGVTDKVVHITETDPNRWAEENLYEVKGLSTANYDMIVKVGGVEHYRFSKDFTIDPDDFRVYPETNPDRYPSCAEHTGTLVTTWSYAGNYNNSRPKTVTIWQGTRKVGTASATNHWVQIKDVYMPPGNYEWEVQEMDCPVRRYPITWKGFYTAKDFKVKKERTCAGLEITMSGVATFQGEDKPGLARFRIVSGPQDTDTRTLYNAGQKIIIAKPGVYVVGMTITSITTGDCAIATETFTYDREPVTVNPRTVTAYACADALGKGHILIKGDKGVPPYRYELWNAANTAPVQVGGKTVEPLDEYNGMAHFAYGMAHDKYTVRIYDNCGVDFYNQEVVISDINDLKIASTDHEDICVGETLEANCLPLSNYKWERLDKPGVIISTSQNLVIPKATTLDSGIYKVTVTLPFCNGTKEGQVTIRVHPCVAPINPHLMNRGLTH